MITHKSPPLFSNWLANPPHLLVAGDAPLAAALGQVLGGAVIPLNALDEQIQEDEVAAGVSYHLLEELQTVMVILPLSAGLTDVARWGDQIWKLVERFSSMGDQHDLRWVWVPIVGNSARIEEGLRVVLSLPPDVLDMAGYGYGIWNPKQSLLDLGRVWQSICPADLLTQRARRNRDGRRRALGMLLGALQGYDPDAVVAAAQEVMAQFSKEKEFLLDVFCQPPSHPNGGELRRWLTEVVTCGVTPHRCSSSRSKVEGWLRPELAPTP